MNYIFISDLHLDESTPNKTQYFKLFMQKIENDTDRLYILGDFFDFWCGDDDRNDFIDDVKGILLNFKKPIFFLGGNHDFIVGKRFAKETHITLLKELSVIHTPKHNILISHGDVFCSLDLNHQKFRSLIQNPIIILMLKLLPLHIRHKIKNKLKNKSHHTYNNHPKETYLPVDETILKFCKEKNANLVINGHSHLPNFYNIKNSDIKRIEIPDWVDRSYGGYVCYNTDSGSYSICKA